MFLWQMLFYLLKYVISSGIVFKLLMINLLILFKYPTKNVWYWKNENLYFHIPRLNFRKQVCTEKNYSYLKSISEVGKNNCC